MAPEIPPELMRIIDEGADREHSKYGKVAETTARLLARHERMVLQQAARRLRDHAEAHVGEVDGATYVAWLAAATVGDMSDELPLTEAIWAAHDAVKDGSVPPDLVEKIARAAVSKYLRTLADQNIVETVRDETMHASSRTDRPVFGADLKRMAKQADEASPVGSCPPEKRRYI